MLIKMITAVITTARIAPITPPAIAPALLPSRDLYIM